jgi:hypothetical protein
MKAMKRLANMVWAMAAWLAAGAAQGQDAGALERPLGEIAAEVEVILAEENVHHAFDLFRLYKEMGFSYQPSLAAPNDLAGTLEGEGLRIYAGMKLFDAVYAATFLMRGEVAGCVEAIEQAQDKLDLRSYADVGNDFLQTLKEAAAEPENVDVRELMAALAAAYVGEVPALMASRESAAYLVDGMYGFTIQLNYVRGVLVDANPALAEKSADLYGTQRVQRMVLDLFDAFGRLGETMRIDGETMNKLWVVRSRYELGRAEAEGRLSDDEAQAMWNVLRVSTAAIRKNVLAGAANR